MRLQLYSLFSDLWVIFCTRFCAYWTQRVGLIHCWTLWKLRTLIWNKTIVFELQNESVVKGVYTARWFTSDWSKAVLEKEMHPGYRTTEEDARGTLQNFWECQRAILSLDITEKPLGAALVQLAPDACIRSWTPPRAGVQPYGAQAAPKLNVLMLTPPMSRP